MDYKDKLKGLFGDMDFSFLKVSEEEALLVIENRGQSYEAIRYRGNSDIEAFKRYKAIPHNNKCMIKAKVVLGDAGASMPLILEYNELELIK